MEQAWSALAAHPVVQSGVAPMGVALITTGVLRLVGNRLGGLHGAGLAIGIAFFASAWLLTGVSFVAPVSALQKLTLLVLAGLVLGAAFETLPISSIVRRATAVGLFFVASLWLAWPQLSRDTLDWSVGVLVFGCGVLLDRLAVTKERHAADSVPIMLAAAGIAGVALVSGSLLIAQLATALAMANGGFLVWNWPRARDTLGASVLMSAALPVMALALLTVLLTPAPPWSLAPLAAVFFLSPAAGRLWSPRGRWREAIQPVYVLVLGFFPVGLAIALALLGESPDDAYYR